MKHFQDGQRIVVTSHSPDEPEFAPLIGKQGTVVRLRFKDISAWVEMDEDLPEVTASFPINDHRRHWIILYPDMCELVPVTAETKA